MEENKDVYFEKNDDVVINIDIVKLSGKLKGSWKFILICAFACALTAFIFCFFIPRRYTTYAVVAPEITTRSSAGGLTSLANLAGINMSSIAVTDAMHPDMYPAIVHSTSFAASLFDMPVTLKVSKDSLLVTDLYDYMLNHYKQPFYKKILSAPYLLISKIFGKEQNEDSILDNSQLSKEEEDVAKMLMKCIGISVEKKTYLMTVSATMQNRKIAVDLANRVVSQLESFVISYRTEKTKLNVEYYKALEQKSKEDYMIAQRRYAQYLDANQGMSRHSVQVEGQRLQNEANLYFQMYNSVAQSLLKEEARLQLESPVMVVIQPAITPRSGKPSKVRTMMLFFFLGIVASGAYILLKK